MKSKIQSTILTAMFLVLYGVSSAVAQKSVELEYKLSVGDSYEFVSEIDQDISFEAMGTTTTLEMDMIFKMTSEVKKIEGDSIHKSFTFNNIKMDQKIFGMEMKYDSDDSTTFNSGMGAQIATEMNKIIGKPSDIVMDNKGTIIDINLSNISDNNDLTNNLTSGSTYAVYPDGKIKVGDSWENDIVPLEDSEMIVHIKYTLLKVSRSQATIGIEGLLSGNEVNGEEINLNGTTVGEMIVDKKTGMLITSTIDLEMEMEMEQAGVKIPASFMTTSITTAKKID